MTAGQVPGANWLRTAMRAIATQTFQYFAFQSRSAQVNGQLLAVFAAPVTLQGSIQPLPRSLYQEYGLQFDRFYVTIYMPENATDVSRDTTGDQFSYNGNRFQAVQKVNWFQQDGWISMLAVQVLQPGS
jgi:hypothetical protein